MIRKKTSRHSVGYQKLENREMLTSIVFDSGALVITGSDGIDNISLVGSSDFQSFTVSISSDPTLTETFLYSDVTELTVFAGGGDDNVTR